jgi:hypothetical protein
MKAWIRELLKSKGVIMENSLIVQTNEAKSVERRSGVHLVARNPIEMAQSRAQLEAWLRAKIKVCDIEGDELGAAAEVAMSNNWHVDTLRKHCNLAKRRGDFYRKVLGAVEAGYTIIPNFPIDVFAVRVMRDSPRRETSTSTWNQEAATRNARGIQAQILPSGEGRYVSNAATGRIGSFPETQNGKEITKYFFSTTDFNDVQFPIEAARPEVMSATAEAMGLRLFEEIGICPPLRQADPLIIGRVLWPKVGGRQQKQVSFLIAWHLDLRML